VKLAGIKKMTSLVEEMALKRRFYSKNRDGDGKRTRGKVKAVLKFRVCVQICYLRSCDVNLKLFLI